MTRLRNTRIIVRNILCAQTPARHVRRAISTRVRRNVASIAQITIPTNVDKVVVILVHKVKCGFDLSARHAHCVLGFALAGECRGTAGVGGREEIVGDGAYSRG